MNDTWTAHKLELQMLEFLVIDNSCYIVWQCRTLQAESPRNNPTQQPHRGPAVPVRPALEAWLRPHVKSRASCGRSWEMISIIDGYVFMDPYDASWTNGHRKNPSKIPVFVLFSVEVKNAMSCLVVLQAITWFFPLVWEWSMTSTWLVWLGRRPRSDGWSAAGIDRAQTGEYDWLLVRLDHHGLLLFRWSS